MAHGQASCLDQQHITVCTMVLADMAMTDLQGPANVLVIVPCGLAKVWAKTPDAGAVAARDAYVGSPFTVNRRYAEWAGDASEILSTTYGFLEPEAPVPGPYEVTFKRATTRPISVAELRAQATRRNFSRTKW
jgi:hypothetical protein